MQSLTYVRGDDIGRVGGGRAGILFESELPRHVTPGGHVARRVRAVCTCGVKFEALLGNLRSGNVKSCGCAVRRRTCAHEYRTKLYSRWASMVRRCRPEGEYGIRGIVVCQEWLTYSEYRDYVSALPNFVVDAGLHLDRIDQNDGYRPGNVQWLTPSQHRIKTGLENTGQGNPSSKLNVANVLEIRRLLDTGANGVTVAAMFGVTPAMISRIKRRKAWGHVRSA